MKTGELWKDKQAPLIVRLKRLVEEDLWLVETFKINNEEKWVLREDDPITELLTEDIYAYFDKIGEEILL